MITDQEQMRLREALSRAYKDTFLNPNGQKILHDLMNLSFMTQTSFSTDPHRTAFNEGKRAAFLHIAGMINLTSQEIYSMISNDQNVFEHMIAETDAEHFEEGPISI